MKRKVFVFTHLYWSVHRVILGVENSLKDTFEFKYLTCSGPYSFSEFMELFDWCDVLLTNLESIRALKDHFSSIDFKKILFVSHGASENHLIKDYDPHTNYGMASDCLKHLFPPNLKLYLTPNGVDPSVFKYRKRDGSLKTLGWGGCPNIPCKRVEWAKIIAKSTNLPLSIGYGMSLDKIVDWYDTIDLLIVTAGPDVDCETGPLPPFEAIVSGVPVIGTYVGNFAKIPGPKFFNLDDAASMVEYLKQNPQRMKDIADEQYEYVMNNFTYEKLAPLWKAALEFS